MFRRSLIIALVLLTVPVAAATWVWSPVLLMAPPSEEKAPEAAAAAKSVALEQPAAKPDLPDLSALAPRTSAPDKPQFDVARIEPDGGWSIFAGTAPPNTFVAITADGIVIGSTKADANGEWTLMSDHRFNSKSPALSLAATAEAPKPVAVASASPSAGATPRSALTRLASPEPQVATPQTTAPAGASAASATPAATPKASAEEATRSMLQNLEKMVAEARAQPAQPASEPATPQATAAATSTPTAATLPAPVAPATASASASVPAAPQTAMVATTPAPSISAPSSSAPVAAPVAPPAAPVPVPIQFVYGEATFTAEGEDAASLLLEFVKLKNPERLSMTGHADERGSDSFNLDLSRRRLQAVAAYLRDNGYRGTFALSPKGRSEPFQGVDRSRFSREALYQLDRRVEFTLETALRRSAEDGGSRGHRSN